jgi:hypothetical protein
MFQKSIFVQYTFLEKIMNYASYQQVQQYSNVNGKINRTEYTVENTNGMVKVNGTVNHRPIRYKGTLKQRMPNTIAQWLRPMLANRTERQLRKTPKRKRSNGKVSKRRRKEKQGKM